MAREIKFRIWDKKHKRWFHGGTDQKSIDLKTDSINLFGEVIVFGEILHDQHEDDVWKNDPDIRGSLDVMDWLEVCQNTGLRDKNGREIFEGDIISEHNGDIIGKVAHHISGEWRILWIGMFGGESSLYEHHFMCEIVGNKHENPELVEEI